MERFRLEDVEVTSNFWKKYRKLIVDTVLPYQWSVMNDEADIHIAGSMGTNAHSKNSHVIENLRIAAGLSEGHFSGYPFQDTDAYKWLEAAAYSFSYNKDDDLRRITDELIDLIDGAQEDDGYLVTYFQIEAPERKFKRLQQSHELYTMGHYIEAGIAYYKATGNEKALKIAERMADCIAENFGTESEKIDGYDGHPEIELALARLFDLTKNEKYLKLLEYFVFRRGYDPEFFEKQIISDGTEREMIKGMRPFPAEYFQADKLVLEQQALEGHAVRVVYLCAGMAYLAKLTDNAELFNACKRFWKNIITKRMYITGGIGSTNLGEAFTSDYDLPNDTNYCETCASVGMIFFAKQMLSNEISSEYGDVIERELFNGAIAGMALDGQHFFYVNPLEADPAISLSNPSRKHILTQRADWFGCACCPSNLARLIASVEQYIYEVKDDLILVDQFIANKAQFADNVTIEQDSNFPWDQSSVLKIDNPERKKLRVGIRIPSWSKNSFKLLLNGQPLLKACEDGYVYVNTAEASCVISIAFDFRVQFIQANSLVRYDFGKVAVQRGPLVYCTESIDNPGALWTYRIDPKGEVAERFHEDLLGGIFVLKASAVKAEEKENEPLYEKYPIETSEKTQMTLVPYYCWANREEGSMAVWQNTT